MAIQQQSLLICLISGEDGKKYYSPQISALGHNPGLAQSETTILKSCLWLILCLNINRREEHWQVFLFVYVIVIRPILATSEVVFMKWHFTFLHVHISKTIDIVCVKEELQAISASVE